jgi:PIN domain nuclease of toxin-antitoxin system
MIVLDTHVWVWWVHDDTRLTDAQIAVIKNNEVDIIGISAITLWEVAKLVERQRLVLPCPISQWFEQSLHYPGMHVMELTPKIVVESTQLPGEFHHDPADQMIVATARVYNCPLVTSDEKIISYPHVEKVW